MNKLNSLISKLFPKKHFTNANFGKSFDEIYEDLGYFKYLENGFNLEYEEHNITVNWQEITELNVTKKDLITIDQIEMEIVYGEKYFVINEDLPGWFQFVKKIKEIFPTIPKDWDINIIQPPFAKSYSNIFKRT